MQKRIFPYLLLLLPLLVHGQFSDDFSDGDFTTHPPWVGDVDKFVVENGVLRLMDQAAGQACLATENSLMEDAQWTFWVRLAFIPSNNNHPRIYLVSDSRDLHGSLNGYYVRIGKSGGDNKRLYFFRQDGDAHTELMAGNMNIAPTTNNQIRITVTRDASGKWEFYADPGGGGLLVPQGAVHDDTHTATMWFGVVCRYTISNANRFYFDDFSVGEHVEDTEPPQVEHLQVESANTLKVFFNKVVDAQSSENTANYLVDRGVGHPLIASRDPSMPNSVSLLFPGNFTVNQVYTLEIGGVEDYLGNPMEAFSDEFVHFVPRRFDVVFNELMVNPTPTVGLPAYEYIELFNTSDFPINLEGWVLQHGSTRRTLPFAPIPAKGFLLLVTEAAYPSLSEFGNVVAVPGLSQVALTNAGADLLLFDPEGNVNAFVSYTDRWYQDPARSNGGWSLEKVDPYNSCQGMENWKASTDPRGGTPGEPNAVLGINPDTTRPDLLRAGHEGPAEIILYFSESMDENVLADASNYQLDHGLGQPVSVAPMLPDFSSVMLNLPEALSPGVVYQLVLDPDMTDCAGNPIDRRTTRVAVPEFAGADDVVINEVLFNPPARGARYVEVYNRSQKVIDLRNHLIASKDTLEGYLITIQEVAQSSFLFFPGDYVVLSANPDAVKKTFMTTNPGGFVRIPGMPRMTNANGVLVFASKSLDIIDMLVYEEDMHLPLLTSYSGVALERVNPDQPTQERSNWHSASRSSGYGTPGFLNSQYSPDRSTGRGSMEVYPEVFSPDGDGQDDLLNIAYAFDEPGMVANVRLFDSRGRLIRLLVSGELLATSGVFTWDGTTDDGLKAPIGIYVIHMEVFGSGGQVMNYRASAVLGGRI
jgi:hypothetical protein